MPKAKTLVVVLFVIAFSFSLLGCDLITSLTASTDEVVEMGGQVPEWLLLSHRSLASEESGIDEDLVAIDEEDEDDEIDEAVGGVDEDDGVTAESNQTEQATSEVAQAAESGSSGSTQQQQESSNEQQESSGGSTFDDMVAKIKPGTAEYNHYMQHRLDSSETPEEFVRRALEAKKEADKAEDQGSFMEWKPRTDFSQSFSNNEDE